MIGCTVIARNYLPQARVLASSFRDRHPDGAFFTLLLDAGPEPDRKEPFELVGPYDIGIEREELHRMAAIYSVLELSTAVKPWLLRTLLDRGFSDVTYFDPDILVLAPLDDVSELARRHGIVLTPHLTDPIPVDDRMIGEREVRMAGAFNLGFIAVSRDADPFLDWWCERLARGCRVDIARGDFVDQRHVDLVPGLFGAYVHRDPTLNVAYWNAHARPVAWDGTRYLVGDSPLRFFHFSGYDPREPWALSRHQGERPRVLLSEHPNLDRLCRQYAEALEANGFADYASLHYGFDVLPNGLALDGRARRVYRAALERSGWTRAEEPPGPFAAGGADDFLDWLNAPADPRGISRYLLAVYEDRPDVRMSFPDLHGDGRAQFLHWIATDGRRQERIPPELLPPLESTDAPLLAPGGREVTEGVNVVGYLTAELGVGEAARQIVGALERADIPFATVVHRDAPSRQRHRFRDDSLAEARYDTNLICINADVLPAFRAQVGPSLFDGRYTIGFWWWEVDVFPAQMLTALDLVDEIWAGSTFVARNIARATGKPVFTVPLPIDVPPPPERTRADLGLPNNFMFLFSFDFGSVFERKNPLALIAAFERAFAPSEGPILVIKSINGDRYVRDLERLRFAAREREDVLVIDGYLDSRDKDALMSLCDCYVSLHRSEGFGLVLAEAMALGKPVIATSYGGNVDFMDDENSFLVDWTEIRVGPDCDPYPPEARWAEPDVAHAARLMRQVVDDPDEARQRARAGSSSLVVSHSREEAAVAIGGRLAEIRQRRAQPARVAQAAESRPTGLERAVTWLESGPTVPWDAPSRFGFAGRTVRRALRRVARPFELRYRELDETVVESLKELNHVVRHLERELSAAGQRHQVFEDRMQSSRAIEQARIDAMRRRSTQLAETLARLDQRIASVAERTGDRLATEAARLEGAINDLRSRLYAEPYTSDPDLLRVVDPLGRPTIGLDRSLGCSSGDLYRGFEDVFRGPEEFIRDRQRSYADLLRGHAPVLDVGCGRGELLDVLTEAGVEATGVDVDEGMVRRCREKRHPVLLADGIRHLSELDEGSLGAVVALQVAEHLTFEELVRFLTGAHRALRPGGRLVVETVNPHALEAMKMFWVDPTHRAPLFPEVVTVLCGLSGFASARVLYPNGSGDPDEDRRTQGEYAVVAEKAAPAP